MKKLLILAITIALMITALSSINTFADESDVILKGSSVIKNDDTGIPDKNLYKAILRKLGKKENQTFTKEEAATIEELDISNFPEMDNYSKKNKITTIKGIENLTGLESLDVIGHNLKSLKGVEKLVKLSSLGASRNSLKVLPDLTKLTNLIPRYTYFFKNKLSTKEFKAKLPAQLLTNRSWLISEIKFQNISSILKLTTPKSSKKITVNTKKIIGKAHKGAKVGLFDSRAKKIKVVKANAKGAFVFKKLKLKKFKNKSVRLSSYMYDGFYAENVTLKSFWFKVRKNKARR